MSESYPAGASVRLKARVTVDDVATTPTGPTCRVRRPNGAIVSIAVTTPAAGDLQAVFDHDAENDPTGDHWFRLDGGGGARGAGEGVFTIRESEVL